MIKNSIQYGKYTFGIVDDKTLLKEAFKLRYQVYVEEFGFENKADHPGGLETDAYENQSIHCVCLNEENAVVGTIRLVLESDKGFPIEHAVPNLSFFGKMPDRKHIAEISRLTVSKDLRRRKEDGRYGVESYIKKKEGGVLPDDGTIPKEFQGRKNPIIVLGLYQIVYQESKRHGITHWYMITEKKLNNTLKKYGFHFRQIGEPVQYHGTRIPFLGIIGEMEQYQLKTNPDMAKIMLTGLEKKYHPQFSDNAPA